MTQQPVIDLVDMYRRSVHCFVERVRQVDPQQWGAPTPCPDWNVRELVNHLAYEDRWTVPIFAGQSVGQVGDRFEGDLLGFDPVGAVVEAAGQAEASVAEPGALERTVNLSFGDTPAREYVLQLTADHLVHAWDLAVATGGDAQLDPELVQLCAGWFIDREEIYRGSGVVGLRVDVPATASDQDRLLAAFGRDPNWSPPI